MGLEAKCTARVGTRKEAGLARLEEKDLTFRGEGGLRIDIPVKGSTALVKGGALKVKWSGGTASFELGAKVAEKWVRKIRYPRTRMEKLGVKPGMRISVLGIDEKAFWRELEALVEDASDGKLQKDSDIVFFFVDDVSPLKRLRELQRSIVPAGAVWVVWPKGQPHIEEDHIRAAASSADLVDVKVCAFSDTLSALKLMIPRDKR